MTQVLLTVLTLRVFCDNEGVEGSYFDNYDAFVNLAHGKGHMMGGFGARGGGAGNLAVCGIARAWFAAV